MIDFGYYYKIGDDTNIRIDLRKTKTQYVVEVGRWSDPLKEPYGSACRGSRTGHIISRLYFKDIIKANKRVESAFLTHVIGKCRNCKKYPDIRRTSGRYKIVLVHDVATCSAKLESYQNSMQVCINDWKSTRSR